ncbi:MAG: hypothetical protein HYV45_02595 [Candidatus Moranbacteria bacterium]|nr:hypothetical protein [Candidatus Moranbacteria bacterium]
MEKNFFTNRRFFVTGFLVFFCLGFIIFFSGNETLSLAFQEAVVGVAFFLVIPTLYCTMILKESLKNIGWHWGELREGIFAGVVSLVVASFLFVVATFLFPEIKEAYALPLFVQKNFLWFVLYEMILVPFTIFLYEMFFRGFVQLLWLRQNGLWGVGVGVSLFFLTMFLQDSITWSLFALFLFCPFSAWIAHRSGSIRYSFFTQWLFLLLADVFLLILQ